MKAKLLILVAVLFVSLFGACNSYKTSLDYNKFFPEKIGEYARVNPQSNFCGVMSQTSYKQPMADLYYAFGAFQSEAEVTAQFDRYKNCNVPDVAQGIVPDVIKEGVLKDRSGKVVGNYRVCRVPLDYLQTTVGNFRYSVLLSNGNNIASISTVKDGKLSDVAQFVDSLPLEPQIDFSSDAKDLIAANSSTPMWAHELLKKEFPVKLAGEPYIKGKYLLVKQTPMSRSAEGDTKTVASFVKALEYRLPPEQVAQSYEEADTVISVDCVKGPQMADYVAQTELKQKTPAYSVKCKLSVIDKTIPAIIAQKDLIGTDLLEQTTLSPNDKEVRALEPIEKIRAFIAQLPKR